MNLLGTKAKDIVIDPIDWPDCVPCGMPVEFFGVVETEDALTFVVRCHGKEKAVTIELEGTSGISMGPVFGEEDE